MLYIALLRSQFGFHVCHISIAIGIVHYGGDLFGGQYTQTHRSIPYDFISFKAQQ